jgi:hypothetical protein
MIYITKDSTTRIALELNGTNPFSPEGWVFAFTPEWSLTEPTRYFTTGITGGTSAAELQRVYEFEIVESPAGSTALTVENLPINLDAGQWRYEVFAATGPVSFATSPAPDPLLLQYPVSVGRMFVDNLNGSPTGAPNSVYS